MKSIITLLLFFFAINLNAQIVVGTINDETGAPIPFSKVWVKSTSYGTIANGKGEFKLELEKTGSYELRFTAATYEPLDTTLKGH